jgi:hypothetical protein
MKKLSAKWVSKCSMLVRSMIEYLLHNPILTDFGRILWDFLTLS